jgi:hypothetical protein
MYIRRIESFGNIYKFSSCKSEQCKHVTALGFATGESLNLAKWLLIGSNHDENYYQWQQLLMEQSLQMSANRSSTIGGCVSAVIKQWFGRCYTWTMYWLLLSAKETATRYHPIHRMSVNVASTTCRFASWIIYDLIGCWHWFIRYW